MAIEGPLRELGIHDVFQLLDFPDAAVTTGDRPTTTIAPQALLMLNSGLIAQASTNLAKRVLDERTDETARISWLHELAYGRPATADEITAGQQFLQAAEKLLAAKAAEPAQRTQLAWEAYCQTILIANEFIYTR